MSKIIELKDSIIIIDDCTNCPFCSYNPNYSISHDSGYDCWKIGRIANDGQIDKYKDKMKEIENQNKSLFKYQGKIPVNPTTPDEDCPLKIKEDE